MDVAPTRRLYRLSRGRMLGGVASGLAEHLGLPVLAVRAAFVVLTAAGGVGVLMYVAFWAVVPDPSGRTALGQSEGWLPFVALGAVAAGALLGLEAVGVVASTSTALPMVAVVLGVALVWRRVGAAPLRLPAGALLLGAGLLGFLASRGQLGAARQGVLSTVVVVAGVALLSGPWWYRLTDDLRAERRERIRSQERAEVAAHVHDSVLQTLALIRKAAGDPREVARLARSQERELRSWLYPGPGEPAVRFAAALERTAADVEETHGTAVEVVTVGDCPPGPRVDALLAAAREAMVNAAKHSGAPVVSVYAEAEPERVTVFVRDRGRGFDVDAVPEGRHGLSESVAGRMSRHGGTAEVRSVPGDGTEVRLELPRA